MGTVDPPHVHRIGGWSTTLVRRRANADQHVHPPIADPGVVRALIAQARSHDAEVMHAHGWIVHSAVRAARALDLPLVVTLHDYGLDCARRSRLLDDGSPCPGPARDRCGPCAAATYGPVRGPLVTAGVRRSRGWWAEVAEFLANSEAVASAARAAGVDATVASPWVTPSVPPDDDDAPANLPRGPFIVYVGAQSRHKGIEVLAEAWGPTAPAPLVALVARSEADPPAFPPGTLVHERLAHHQVLATMARAVVTVVPSRFAEPFGLVAAESMWAGTPVVASATGGLPWVLDNGAAGILVPPGDPAALRRAVDELLHDPQRRVELAAAGRSRVLELDGARAAIAAYQRVLGRQPQASPAALRT
jgi:glycosyltransferase involved in cell wall biosynthesis